MSLLPVRGASESAEAFLDRLMPVLSRALNGPQPATAQTILDNQGRVIVDPAGLYVYALDGTMPVAADIVAIDTTQIVDAAVATSKLADGAVTQTKIANLAVGTLQVADAAIVTAKVGDLQVTTAKIADLAVNSAKIANLAVGTAQISDAAITNAKVNDLDAAKITAGTLNAARIGAGSIDATKMSVATLSAITANFGTMTAGTLTAGVSYLGTVLASQISTSSLSAISANLGTITAGTLNATVSYLGQVNATQVNAGTLAAGVILASNIAATQISAGTLAVGVILSSSIAATQITAGTFTGFTFQTAASGDRVVIDHTVNNILCYSGSNIVEINKYGFGAVYASSNTVSIPTLKGVNANAMPGVWGESTGGAGLYGVGNGTGFGCEGHGKHGGYFVGTGYGDSKGVVAEGDNYDFYANGAGTNYGPFTGTHDALLAKAEALEFGDIVRDSGLIVARKSLSSAIGLVTLATAGQVPVGVITSRGALTTDTCPAALIDHWEVTTVDLRTVRTAVPVADFADLCAAYDLVTVNGLGEGLINVCGASGDIPLGALLEVSTIAGKGSPQADSMVRAATAAKAREAVAFSGDETKQIACIYLCG